jgi:hypothetical protein
MTNPWITVAEAARARGKSVETIRRWARDYPDSLRTTIIGGTTHLHEGDLHELAARHPAPNPERATCARKGHLPPATVEGALDALADGDLVTLRDASNIAGRTKTAILRWAAQGAVRALTCRCGGRSYIYTADIEPARQRFDRNRKRTNR